MAGRQLYEVWFRCMCGELHSVPLPKPVPFLNPELAAESLARFYSRNQRLPEGLDDFLKKDFICPITKEPVDLPALDQFLFKGTGAFIEMHG